MKRLSVVMCGVAIVLMASAAIAQQPGRPGRGQGRPGGPGGRGFGMFMPALIRALDADSDGTISKEEIANAVEVLKKLDADGDGQLTRQEYMGAGGRGGPGGRAGGPGGPGGGDFLARIKEADKNGDGKISKEEAPEFLQRGFDRVDANSDGFLDETELRQLAERFRGRAGGARPGGAGRPGGARRPPSDN